MFQSATRQMPVRRLWYDLRMYSYRIDFFCAKGDRFATHAIECDGDRAAIVSGHSINGFPTIGAGFHIWREDQLIYRHTNEPQFAAEDRVLA